MARLSVKSRIAAAIRRAGPDGIAGDDLFAIIYGSSLPPLPQRTVLKAHVWQLRAIGTPIRSYGRAGGGYRWSK